MTAPTLTGFTPALTVDENTVNATPQVIDSDVTFADADNDFSGGRLVMSGLRAEDRVSVRNQGTDPGQIGVSGTDITYGGVVIGTLAGGSGSNLTITFNASATAAAIEALIENLTYANVSHAPTANRTLALQITDAAGNVLDGTTAGVSTFTQQTGSNNPFNGLGFNGQLNSAFFDFDGDGDQDMMTADGGGQVRAWRNNGGAFSELSGSARPFNGLNLSSWADIAVADLDGDGDMDLVGSGAVQTWNGGYWGGYTTTYPLRTYINNGNGNYSQTNTLSSNVGPEAHPTFADMDGDGDQDLIVHSGSYGAGHGTMRYFRNNGGGSFSEMGGSSNPFNGVNFGSSPALAMADLDGDGDLDAVSGQSNGTLRTWRNDGSGNWAELTGSNNPFNGVNVGSSRANPTFVDLDGDQDMDLVVGSDNGTFAYYMNTTVRGQGVAVTVTAQNDAIVHSGLPTDVTVVEEVASNLDLSALSISDPDVVGNITVVLTADSGTMTAASGGGVTVSGSATGTLTLVGTAAAIDAFLNSASNIKYTGALDDQGDNAATITVTADDGSGAVTVGTVNLDITNTTEAPVLTGFASSATFNENDINGAPALLDADVEFSDFEDDFTGGSLRISGLLADDRVSVRNQGADPGQIGLSGSDVTYGGVVIGTLAGGSGSTLTITFNADADAEAIEALVENLTYATVSNNPTASHNLALNITDAQGQSLTGGSTTGGAILAQVTGSENPFNGLTGLAARAMPTFGDFDGDGDQDMILATGSSSPFRYFQNSGGAFTERTGSNNPFNNITAGDYRDPALVDIDGDGDMDLVVHTRYSNTRTYINNSGALTEVTGSNNPLNNFAGNYRASPTFADIDGDGDQDYILSNGGSLRFIRNNGNGTFSEQSGSNNPFNGVGFGSSVAPAFIDLDGDGDLDVVAGQGYGTFRTFRNDGSGSWTELTGSNNPLNGVSVSGSAAPTVADIDGDGDMDLVSGGNNGVLTVFRNNAPRGQIITVNVTAQNDAIVHSGLPTDVTVVEEVASNLDLSALSISDPDVVGNISVVLTADSGTMTATSGGGVTITGSATGTLTLTGTAAAIDAFLNTASNIKYIGADDVDGNDAATITVTANDGSGVVTIGTVNVDITNTTEAPELTGFGPTLTFAENAANGAPQLMDIDVEFSDFEDTFDGGSLVISGLLAEDRISVRNQGTGAGEIGLSGSDVTYGGVVIGTLSGGAGNRLTITFNASANAEAIEALVENLTYANTSNNPTASRNLAINIVDADGQGLGGTGSVGTATFSQQSGSSNPFNSISIGGGSNSVFYDFDADGDVDMLATDNNGQVRAYRNNGSSFAEVSGSSHPFNGLNISSWGDLALADVDGDGDLDLMVSGRRSYSYYSSSYQLRTFVSNGGGSWSERSTTGITGVTNGHRADPTSADIDGDGDLDLITSSNGYGGDGQGSVRFFRNNGNGTFSELTGTNNPLDNLPHIGGNAAVAFSDLDGDGDLDAVAGQDQGTIRTFINGGSGSWSELTGSNNPFNGADVGYWANPTFADVDGDGDMDLVVGANDGRFHYFMNTTPRGQVVTVNVTAEHDAVSVSGLPTDIAMVEDAAGNLDMSSITLTDPDVTGDITVVLTASAGTMVAQSTGGVTVTGSTTGTLTLVGTTSAIDAFLNTASNIRYTGALNANGENVATVTVTVDGGTGAVTAGVVNLDISSVNDAPTLSGFASTANFIEGEVNAGPQLIDADVNFSDVEGNLDGGALTVSGLLTEDRVAVRNEGAGAGQIGVSGSNVTYGGVVIGSLSGGAGATLTVTLNAAATSAAVDALIQNLTYANVSNNPAVTRTLTLNVTDAAGMNLTGAGQGASFSQMIGGSNPFTNFPINLTNTQSLVDLDRDGDMDVVAGDANGTLRYWLNANGTFTEQTGGNNPFNGIDVGNWSDPAFADLDGDGDLDVVVGDQGGSIRSFRNNGSSFAEMTGGANPFNGLNGGYRAAPTFQDMDGDGDLDLIINSQGGGTPIYFQNTTPRPSASTVTVNIVGQNDAPIATGLPTDVSVQGETLSNLDLSAVTLTDVDTPGAITVRLTATVGLLTSASAGGVTVSGSGTGALTLTGTAAAIDAFLNSASAVQYTGPLNLSGDNAATVTVTADDGSGVVTLGVVNVDIASMDDFIAGDAGANTLYGYSGNDTLSGRGGNDILNGGAGSDTADYSAATAGVVVRIDLNRATNDGEGGQDTFISIENATGSAFDDTLFGDANANVLNGGTGRDTLIGGGGNDTLIGGTGAANTLQGGLGDDTYVVHAVGDSIVELANEGNDTVRTSRTTFTLGANLENLTYTGSDAFRGTGNASANILTGGSGADVLIGRGGADTLNGGGGIDLVDYSGAAGGVNANLFTGVVSDDGDGASDTISGVENLIGSAFADILAGNASANVLTGGNGDDVLSGGAGTDTLIGGAGVDTASYATAASGVRVAINSGVLGDGSASNDGDGSTDTLSGIENLTGSDFADTLIGSAAANVLVGGLGADLLLGNGGNDTLVGGGGAANTLQGGLGDDIYVVTAADSVYEAANEGTDTVQTDRGNFTLGANIENLTYIGVGNFGGTGNALANVITGGTGMDTLTGRGGNDTLNGAGGFDTADFTGARLDYLIENLGDGRFRVTDTVGGRDGVDILEGIEQVRFSGGVVISLASIPASAPVVSSKDAGPQVLPTLDGGKSADGDALVLPALMDDGFLLKASSDEPLVRPGLSDDAAKWFGFDEPLVRPNEFEGLRADLLGHGNFGLPGTVDLGDDALAHNAFGHTDGWWL